MEIIKIEGTEFKFGLRSNSFLLINGGCCCVIDPSFPPEYVEQKLRKFCGKEVKITAVVLTHCHADHCASLGEYAGAKIFLSHQTLQNLNDSKITLSNEILGKILDFTKVEKNFEIICDCEKLELLPGALFKVKFTPGHTSDSICIYNKEDIFVGDLIFANGGFGRCDMPTGSKTKMRESIRWIKEQNSTLCVHSGHGEDFLLSTWDI